MLIPIMISETGISTRPITQRGGWSVCGSRMIWASQMPPASSAITAPMVTISGNIAYLLAAGAGGIPKLSEKGNVRGAEALRIAAFQTASTKQRRDP
ncbi:MAG TPA: hypothetical protein VFU22_20865 [Roseiflexaceae bacterium]|nr:hypothetical protein [Roseiflexaceae bacterium]